MRHTPLLFAGAVLFALAACTSAPTTPTPDGPPLDLVPVVHSDTTGRGPGGVVGGG